MIISEHLSLAELIASDSAKRRGISNMPTPEHIANLKQLAEHVFEPIRAHFRCPIFISSGYRSEELNRLIGGASSSQHSKGEAIDIDMDGSSDGVSNLDIFNYIKSNLKFDQLIYEFGNPSNPDWVHVSYTTKKPLRNEILKGFKAGGSTIYTKVS